MDEQQSLLELAIDKVYLGMQLREGHDKKVDVVYRTLLDEYRFYQEKHIRLYKKYHRSRLEILDDKPKPHRRNSR